MRAAHSAVPDCHPSGPGEAPPVSITIKHVAQRAGVAVSTVSRVLNQSGYVSPETASKVRAAVEELGFRPSLPARTLVSGETRTLALMLPDISNPFFPALARGVEDRAISRGYSVMLCNTDGDPEIEARYIRLLREKWVDGMVMTGASGSASQVKQLLQNRIPVVVIDRAVRGAEVDLVGLDNIAGARLAVEHLARLGHRAIGLIAGPKVSTSLDRAEGYRRALRAMGLPIRREWMVTGDFRFESGYEAMKGLLNARDRPAAIFASNDLMAIGAIRAAEEAGLRVPEDLAVVGFDDIMLATLVRPALSTIRQPAYEMGAAAVDLLLDRITGQRESPPRTVAFEPELIVRQSCGAGTAGAPFPGGTTGAPILPAPSGRI